LLALSVRHIPQDPLSVVTYESGKVEGLAVDKVAGEESVKSVPLNTQRLFTNRIGTQTSAR